LLRTSSADEYVRRFGPVLDGPHGAGPKNPWYGNTWQPTLANPSVPAGGTLSDYDSPAGSTPLDFQKHTSARDVALSPNPLINTDGEISFALYVCAETTQTVNDANLEYAAEAEADWKFNGSGTVASAIKGYLWNRAAGAGVTPPTGWNPVTPGTFVQTPGMIGNDIADAAQFK
jgi:hypothetical protein